MSRRLNIFCIVFKIRVLHCSSVHPVICESWRFTHMWKTVAWPHHFTKRRVWGHKTSLTPSLYIEVPVPRQEGERSCIGVLWVSILPLFLRFCNWTLVELFRQWSIFVFLFYCINIGPIVDMIINFLFQMSDTSFYEPIVNCL